MKILLTGGTGFVGSHLLDRLRRQGHQIRLLVRHAVSGREPAGASGQAEMVGGDVVSGAGVQEAMQSCDAVIHLVGIIRETRGRTFDDVHHQGTRNVVAAAKRAGTQRLVHMSALGARANGVSGYQTSKWLAEEEVRRSGISYTILRPSIIFGPRDGFVSQMVQLMKAVPLVRPVVGHGGYQFQPIYIANVVDCFVQALTVEKAKNRTIELGGPEKLTLDRMLGEIAAVVGVRKFPLHIPFGLMYLNAALLGVILRQPPVTTDQLRMLREGSTCDLGPMLAAFDLNLVGFREGLQQYLGSG